MKEKSANWVQKNNEILKKNSVNAADIFDWGSDEKQVNFLEWPYPSL